MSYDSWKTDIPETHDLYSCNCERCHKQHVEDGLFIEGCCADEICRACKGTGYVIDGETDCEKCNATGRIS